LGFEDKNIRVRTASKKLIARSTCEFASSISLKMYMFPTQALAFAKSVYSSHYSKIRSPVITHIDKYIRNSFSCIITTIIIILEPIGRVGHFDPKKSRNFDPEVPTRVTDRSLGMAK
jgi:hypothetical protein